MAAMSDVRPPDPPGYQLGFSLGRGAAGPVYRGTQLSTGQAVAVKLLEHATPQGRGELDRMLEGLQHPHLVNLLDADLAAAPAYVVMPLMQGSFVTYREQLSPKDRIPERLLLVWLKQLGAGLEYLHGRGHVHCRLHPRNILLDGEGGARLADAGQGLALAGGRGADGCMPPEQAVGGPPSPAWDIYGLGASFHYLLTGRYPHGTPVRKLARHISPALARTIDGCLHRDPARRWQSVPDLLAAMKPRAGLGVDALVWRWARQPSSRPSEPSQVLRWLLSMLAGVALAAGLRAFLPLPLALALALPAVPMLARPGATRHLVRELWGPLTMVGFVLLTLTPLYTALAEDVGLPAVYLTQALLLAAFLSSPSRLLPGQRRKWAGALVVLAVAGAIARKVF